MSVPWELFLLVISGLLGLAAVILGGFKYFASKFLDGIEKQFCVVFEKLDKYNDQVGDTSAALADHKLYAAETFVTRDECRERRDECPARKAILE